jgi:hypothetical protein
VGKPPTVKDLQARIQAQSTILIGKNAHLAAALGAERNSTCVHCRGAGWLFIRKLN